MQIVLFITPIKNMTEQFPIKIQLGTNEGSTGDFDQCSNKLQLDLIFILVNFSCQLRHIMTRYMYMYSFLEIRRVF